MAEDIVPAKLIRSSSCSSHDCNKCACAQ